MENVSSPYSSTVGGGNAYFIWGQAAKKLIVLFPKCTI